MKIDIKKISRAIVFHIQILLKGFVKMLCGALMTAMIVTGIYGFLSVPEEGGYTAVSDFLVSACIVIIAVGGMYLMGGRGKKGAKK